MYLVKVLVSIYVKESFRRIQSASSQSNIVKVEILLQNSTLRSKNTTRATVRRFFLAGMHQQSFPMKRGACDYFLTGAWL